MQLSQHLLSGENCTIICQEQLTVSEKQAWTSSMETLIAPAWHGHNPMTNVGNLHSRLLSMFFILELISRMVVAATVVWVTLNSVFYLKQFKQRHKTNKQTKINRDTSTGLSQVSFSKNAIFSAYATLLLYICLGKNTSYHFCLATTETDSI